LLLLHFVVPFWDFRILPKIDHNPFLFLQGEKTSFQETTAYKIAYDVLLFCGFVVQHLAMSTPTFKSSMNQMTQNQYWFVERPAFILASALMEIYYIFKFLPATEVAFEGFKSTTMYFVSVWMTLVGIYLYIRGKADFFNTPVDYYGFGFLKHLFQQGTDFPL